MTTAKVDSVNSLLRCAVFALALGNAVAVEDVPATGHSVSELSPRARVHLGKTADWVAISDDAVWVGTTGRVLAHCPAALRDPNQ